MLDFHPDTVRPDHSVGAFSAPPLKLEDESIARRMATVILRQAGEGQATEYRHFTEADETRHLTADEIARHIGAARRLADRKVIRQLDEDYLPLDLGDPTARPIAERMAEIIRGMSNARSAVDALQRCGHFTGTEIAAHIDPAKAIVERRLGRVAPPNPSLVALAFSLKRMVTAVQNEVA